ncbi:hypothetical protein BDZ89DRAFT_632962 [Hymenopellis radicata]|nr:hypothetical protein BDZ89DRAFT_632962 [Hymenopellis radicata]
MSENSMQAAFAEQTASFYNRDEAAASQSVLMASIVSSLPRTTPASKRMRTVSTDSDSSPAPRRRLGTVIMRDDIPLPGREVMHLAPFLRLKSARLVPNLPILFAAPAWDAVKAQGTKVDTRFNKLAREKEREKVAGHDSVPIANLPQLRKAQDYREEMVTAFAAALVEHSAIARHPTFLEWRKTPKSLQLGSAEASTALASGYVSIDDTFLGASQTFRTLWRAALDAIQHFNLSDIRVTDFQAICAPLNGAFPLDLIERVVEEGLDLDSFDCRGQFDPVYYCESKDCQVGSLGRRAVTGRPTGVDSERVLALLQRAMKSHGPKVPTTAEEKKLVSLFLHILWAKAVAVDATCITVSGGNKELIFIRVRKTQTFYMSKVLDVPRPARPEPSHTSVHTGYDMFAFFETTERALFNKEHQSGGTLPVSMRTLYDVDINPLKSALDFSVLAPIYEVSVGTFLSRRLSDGSYTFYQLRWLLSAGYN